jgi:heterotetrameric sarcosine oxidase gamma subunit
MNEPTKRTPIYDLVRDQGASFTDVAGWQVPHAFAQDRKAPEGVGLADRSARGKVLVEGASAEAVLRRAWDVPQLGVNRGAPFALGHVYCLRPDRFYLSVAPGAENEIVDNTERVAPGAEGEGAVQDDDGLVTVTDVTHGRSELWLVGPAASELLSRLCGLDFHPHRFPDLTARESSVAKTAQLVIRSDQGRWPAYAVIGPRSLGAYLWETIVEAGRDLKLVLLGEALLQELGDNQEGHGRS